MATVAQFTDADVAAAIAVADVPVTIVAPIIPPPSRRIFPTAGFHDLDYLSNSKQKERKL